MRGEASVVASTGEPITSTDIRAALVRAGVAYGGVVIVHSSLSRIGWVVGGAQSVVEALLDAVGPQGTIVMPAQTGISDPSTWQHPPVPERWWPVIREHWPTFDPRTTPLRAMGAVVECFRRLPDVVYSGHPSSGFVARGPLAQTICASHPLGESFGDDSPLGRLYEEGALVVLIGVGHGNNTSLHLAESRAVFAGKTTTSDGAPLLVDGVRTWVTYDDLDYDESDFTELGAAFVSSGGAEERVAIGIGEIRACDMRELVDFGEAWISTHRVQEAER